ncbi:MAG TPA: exodeoxyribonuclease VII large subunit, partial [Acidimicrobiia bacterium]
MEQSAFEFGLEDAEPEVLTFSVGQLNGLVRDELRRAFPVEVWVRGEVQNLKRSGAGHTYFTVVEKAERSDRVLARLDVVLFRDDRHGVERAIAEVPGAELGDDVEVRIRGRVTMYPASGRY